jgi:hypothetical protein
MWRPKIAGMKKVAKRSGVASIRRTSAGATAPEALKCFTFPGKAPAGPKCPQSKMLKPTNRMALDRRRSFSLAVLIARHKPKAASRFSG